MKNWKTELEKLEIEANKRLDDMDEIDRGNFVTAITEADEIVRRERAKSFDKLKQMYGEEMNNEGADPDLFLLTFAEKDNKKSDRSSKNQRGHPPSRGRRRRWQRD